MTQEDCLDVIEEWQIFWMSQTQNNQDDFENYFGRALGVDANMRHHLADLMAKKIQSKKIISDINKTAFENLQRKLSEANARIVEFEEIKQGHLEVQKKLTEEIEQLRKLEPKSNLVEVVWCTCPEKKNDGSPFDGVSYNCPRHGR